MLSVGFIAVAKHEIRASAGSLVARLLSIQSNSDFKSCGPVGIVARALQRELRRDAKAGDSADDSGEEQKKRNVDVES